MSEQFDWRSAAAARGLEITDLAENVATSIGGLDLGEELDDEIVSIIRAACVSTARPAERCVPNNCFTGSVTRSNLTVSPIL